MISPTGGDGAGDQNPPRRPPVAVVDRALNAEHMRGGTNNQGPRGHTASRSADELEQRTRAIPGCTRYHAPAASHRDRPEERRADDRYAARPPAGENGGEADAHDPTRADHRRSEIKPGGNAPTRRHLSVGARSMPVIAATRAGGAPAIASARHGRPSVARWTRREADTWRRRHAGMSTSLYHECDR